MGFNDVHDVVAELFAIVDHVHVMHAHLVSVLLLFDIRDILFLEQLAVIVDFIFEV